MADELNFFAELADEFPDASFEEKLPAVATSAITSSLLSQIASSPSSANQFVSDLSQLAEDLESGNLSAAQEDYVTLSQDALSGATSSTATTSASGITPSLLSQIASSPSSASSFASELDQLGTDLSNGDLTFAQGDMLSLESMALNDASSSATSSPATSGLTTATNQGETEELIDAVVQALEAGDSSVASSALSQLASVSSSSQGAGYLEQLSQSLGSTSGGSSSSSSIGELLQSLNADNSSSSTSALSLLA